MGGGLASKASILILQAPCTIPAKTTATVWQGAGSVWDVFPSRSGSFICLNTIPFPESLTFQHRAESSTVARTLGVPSFYNFGVNAASWEQFTIPPPSGMTLTFTPAEMLESIASWPPLDSKR